jgi:hypothetical protein
MRRRGRRTVELKHEVVQIAVIPVFARFERPDDGMADSVVVRGGVLPRGVVTAPDVAALLADAKVHPVVSPFSETLDTAVARWWQIADLVEVGTRLRHWKTLFIYGLAIGEVTSMRSLFHPIRPAVAA